jgi:cysteine desulfurase
MLDLPIYLDNHATTRVDPRVIEAMLPYFTEVYGNPGSVSHAFGAAAKDTVDDCRAKIAAAIGAKTKEIVWTSGATESNNLALRGVAEKNSVRGKHIISVATEHPAVLDPLTKLARRGFEITLLPVIAAPGPQAGLIRIEQLAAAIREDTILVSIMLANNEIGVIQPLAEIGRLCKQRGVFLHSDATQAVGKIPVDVETLGVDLMSFTAHKIYGPKGIGALYVRSRGPRVRLEPQIDGGGQEGGLRSGTANVPGIVGFARALELCLAELPGESLRQCGLRDRLFAGLTSGLRDVRLNGPALDLPTMAEPTQGVLCWCPLRLPGNLNVSFGYVEGEALMIEMRNIAVSTGSACTSAQPEPSHVLRALGLSEDAVRGSLRFGLGRFTTAEEIEYVIARAVEAVTRLRTMSSMA